MTTNLCHIDWSDVNRELFSQGKYQVLRAVKFLESN